jgi:quinol monooxygenase YgiN
MSVRMVRAKIKAGKTAELEQAAREMFAAIDAAAPQGVRYASCKLPDGETFVILLELDDDTDNPLLGVPAFREFQATLQNWIAEPPEVEQLTPVGSYRLF